jgi:hypothetical protein
MILKGSQRGGGQALGLHLLKTTENEHVEAHEIRGFVAQTADSDEGAHLFRFIDAHAFRQIGAHP